MLSKNTLEFLRKLKENNDREWFAQNKDWYEQSKSDFESLVIKLIAYISSFDDEMRYLDPRKCIFRIYRDTRFSQDKSPYKTHFGAVFHPQGLSKSSGYYLHVEPEQCFLTCGHYMLLPDQLKKMRRGIYDDYDTLRSILDEENFKKEIGDLFRDEDVLKRVPNGFEKDSPAAEYLKLKHFYALKSVSDKKVLDNDFIEYASKIYHTMYPLGRFLNDILLS